jgi:hypothetical protein
MNPETTAYAERVVNSRQGQVSQMLKVLGGV